MNERTKGWLWIGGVLAIVVFLVAGGGRLLWGALLAANEVLPRIGYAKPTLDHPAVWLCE